MIGKERVREIVKIVDKPSRLRVIRGSRRPGCEDDGDQLRVKEAVLPDFYF
jgi:hypothetical protein